MVWNHIGEIRTLVMDSASQFKPKAPYPFLLIKILLLQRGQTYDVGIDF
jgi:hypothetical protein